MNKIKRIPTCDICGKQFKTTQGLGGHRVLYHRSEVKEREQNSTSIDSKQLESFLNRMSTLENEVRTLHSKMISKETLPIGLLELVVCLKCGMVLELDKAFRKGNWIEDAHLECPRCGSVDEVIELITRQRINANTYSEI